MYKVLIVDDKSLIRKGIISSINWKELGIELAGEAENGQKALKIVENVRPDIVVTDIKMPDMDGLELLKNLSDFDNQIVKIVISGYDDFAYAQKAIKYGSIDYIMKPINPGELNESLRKACALLDKNKMLVHSNEQLLKDFFQKIIKEIRFDSLEYRTILEEYALESSVFCVVILKNRTGKPVANDGFLFPDSIKVCSFEEDKGITALICFCVSKSMSVPVFELAVNKSVTDFMQQYRLEDMLAGIGQVADGLDGIINSYKTAYEAAIYCALSRNENIVSYSRLANKKLLDVKPEEYESELVFAITSGNAKNVAQVLERLFDRVFGCQDIAVESIKLLLRNLCHILLKLNVEFKSEINDFLDKISLPGYLLKFESIRDLSQVVCNFYNFAVQKYIGESGGKNSLVTKVKSFIDKNYSSNISLSELSSIFHINASYLTRIFKQEEGDSVNAYIIKVRIDNAKKILESGRVNIEKLAESVGYEDSTYFFKVFKRVTGMTPREYLLKKQKQ